MKREDIIRMAREAAQSSQPGMVPVLNIEQLERFAALVAASEREAMVDEAAKQGWAMKNEDSFEDAVREIAAIRTRGQA